MRQIFLFAPTYAVVIICVFVVSFCSKKYPLAITHSADIHIQMIVIVAQARDVIITAMENASWSQTKLATHIKKAFDNSFGAAWHVSVCFLFSSILCKLST